MRLSATYLRRSNVGTNLARWYPQNVPSLGCSLLFVPFFFFVWVLLADKDPTATHREAHAKVPSFIWLRANIVRILQLFTEAPIIEPSLIFMQDTHEVEARKDSHQFTDLTPTPQAQRK